MARTSALVIRQKRRLFPGHLPHIHRSNAGWTAALTGAKKTGETGKFFFEIRAKNVRSNTLLDEVQCSQAAVTVFVSVIVLAPKDEYLLPRSDARDDKERQTALSLFVRCRLEAKQVAALEKCERRLEVEVNISVLEFLYLF